MTYTLTPEDIDALTDALGDHAQEGTDAFRAAYSGTGMYGSACIAFDVSDLREAVQIITACAVPAPDLAAELAEALTLEDMGRGKVAYFPGVTVAQATRPDEGDDIPGDGPDDGGLTPADRDLQDDGDWLRFEGHML